jgi:CheY-like chemotaxis protein
VLALYARVAHVLTPTAALALGRHAGMGFELLGADTPARVKLRAYVDRLRAEITNPGLGQTTQIIVVEPAAPMRSRIARCLESAGFKVNAVADVPDAFEACTVWRPDTIVAAASIGAMSGIDLAMAMADNDALSDVPLILTGDRRRSRPARGVSRRRARLHDPAVPRRGAGDPASIVWPAPASAVCACCAATWPRSRWHAAVAVRVRAQVGRPASLVGGGERRGCSVAERSVVKVEASAKNVRCGRATS